MAIEIKELVVEINVSNSKKTVEKGDGNQISSTQQKEMLSEFIEQMTTLIDKKNER